MNNKNMKGYSRKHGGGQEAGNNQNAADPSVLGLPFHNPYTFIPFPDKEAFRDVPFPLTIDEVSSDFKTGLLEVEVTTKSPLLCCSPTPLDKNASHKVYPALTIGNDVVMPASSVRGALRTLMTVITGGTLGYMDEDLWLCQGRDLQFGPNKEHRNRKVFIGEVVTAGDSQHDGRIRLGETKLVKADSLEKISGFKCKFFRPDKKKVPEVWIDSPDKPTSFSKTRDSNHQWRVKLSGTPIKKQGKKEGAFKPGDIIIDIPSFLWREYHGRNRHGIRNELRKNDLVWLEPRDPDCDKIDSAKDIVSLQWARWGRKGVSLSSKIPEHIRPDANAKDGYVDKVTELFGQIPASGNKKAAGPFAGRVRPHNLVFFDAKSHLIAKVALAPLSAPHPGCIAFYRDSNNLDQISQHSPLKGYKIYRTTKERDKNAPWLYSVQGVYGEQGELNTPFQQNVNKTVDLVPEGMKGRLRIAFRALSDEDIALLVSACDIDWRLGGGKPLGLGHCGVKVVRLLDEEGNEMDLTQYRNKIREEIKERIRMYKASVEPVEKLRYPRAVVQNKNTNNRSGLSWFAKYASPKKNKTGLITTWTAGNLKQKAGNNTQIKAQALPKLDPDRPDADLLYGYDGLQNTLDGENGKKLVKDIEAFDVNKHRHYVGRATENTSQNRDSRKKGRQGRIPPSA